MDTNSPCWHSISKVGAKWPTIWRGSCLPCLNSLFLLKCKTEKLSFMLLAPPGVFKGSEVFWEAANITCLPPQTCFIFVKGFNNHREILESGRNYKTSSRRHRKNFPLLNLFNTDVLVSQLTLWTHFTHKSKVHHLPFISTVHCKLGN